tara:strand:+ start:392 stop:601 length:210 start_codon:yes stop_codon:yes gene_type:complete
MEQNVGEFSVQSSAKDEVFIVRGSAWIQVESKDGAMVVTAYSNNGHGRDGIPLCSIDKNGFITKDEGGE